MTVVVATYSCLRCFGAIANKFHWMDSIDRKSGELLFDFSRKNIWPFTRKKNMKKSWLVVFAVLAVGVTMVVLWQTGQLGGTTSAVDPDTPTPAAPASDTMLLETFPILGAPLTLNFVQHSITLRNNNSMKVETFDATTQRFVGKATSSGTSWANGEFVTVPAGWKTSTASVEIGGTIIVQGQMSSRKHQLFFLDLSGTSQTLDLFTDSTINRLDSVIQCVHSTVYIGYMMRETFILDKCSRTDGVWTKTNVINTTNARRLHMVTNTYYLLTDSQQFVVPWPIAVDQTLTMPTHLAVNGSVIALLSGTLILVLRTSDSSMQPEAFQVTNTNVVSLGFGEVFPSGVILATDPLTPFFAVAYFGHGGELGWLSLYQVPATLKTTTDVFKLKLHTWNFLRVYKTGVIQMRRDYANRLLIELGLVGEDNKTDQFHLLCS
jgi:hypothetical protein